MIRNFKILCLLLFCSAAVSAQVFKNPVLKGFYPDPSVCRAGEDYYMVNSTFAYFPGLPIFHSKDLLNWKQVGNVMNDPEQLNLHGFNNHQGLYAPAIAYHDGLFYVACTVIGGKGNYVVTSTDPKSNKWSEPHWIPEAIGIDPSLFFDEDGKVYVVYNSGAPDNKPLYDGHCTIRILELQPNTLKAIGDNRILVNGGVDLSKKPVWIEGPHLYKRNGWYYLMAAEGGTEENHSEVIFRSRSLAEPFIAYQKNPILTQRHLPKERPDPITSTGHADIFEGPDGNWYGVFLGCRPYEDNHYNTGRETFMAPVKWEDDWPVFDLQQDVVKATYPINAIAEPEGERFNGSFVFRDDFENPELNFRYLFLRTPTEKWHSIQQGVLQLTLRAETVAGPANPSFVGFRQSHMIGHAATRMEFSAANDKESAGLIIYENDAHYYLLVKTIRDNNPVIELIKSGPDQGSVILASVNLNENTLPIELKIEARADHYNFYFAEKAGHWNLLKSHVDAKFLSTKTAGGFVGAVHAMYATSNGHPSDNTAKFDWFEQKTDK